MGAPTSTELTISASKICHLVFQKRRRLSLRSSSCEETKTPKDAITAIIQLIRSSSYFRSYDHKIDRVFAWHGPGKVRHRSPIEGPKLEQAIKLRDLTRPFYVAVTGATDSTPIFDSMAVLGSDVVRIRLRRATAALGPISATRTKELEADPGAEPSPRPTAKILDLRREATMRRSPVAWCGLAFLVSFPTFGAETIVERIDLIDVRWAEASLASGPGLTIPAALSTPGEPSTGKGDEYPFLWRIEFFEGRRTNKTPGEIGEKAVVEDTNRRVGGLYIVGDFADGRDGAKIYGRELEAAVRRMWVPETLAGYFQ